MTDKLQDKLQNDLDRFNTDFNKLSKDDQNTLLDVFGLDKLKGMNDIKISIKKNKPKWYERIANYFK